MDIVNLCCYGEGNYSGASYEENIVIPKNTYEQVKSDIESLEEIGRASCRERV